MSTASLRRLGVLGGTFDPVHTGHLVAAVNVRHALNLDRVLLVVANAPWQKSGRRHHAGRRPPGRGRGCGARLAGRRGQRHRDRPGRRLLHRRHARSSSKPTRPGAVSHRGQSDVAADLHTWRRPDVVARLATLVVVTRGGSPDVDPGPPWRVEHVRIPKLDISSSDLRARAADGRPLEHLVPLPAIACIRRTWPVRWRQMTTTADQVRDWARTAARAASAKGGEETVIVEVGAVLAITDAFVITSGRNTRQVKTIAEEVEAKLKAGGRHRPAAGRGPERQPMGASRLRRPGGPRLPGRDPRVLRPRAALVGCPSRRLGGIPKSILRSRS